MADILLVHWNEEEAQRHAALLERSGHRVRLMWDSKQDVSAYRGLRSSSPDVIVIGLERLPSHGRALGIYVRQQKALREVPIVFVAGETAKTTKTRQLLPDAHYVEDWKRIRGAVTKAMNAKSAAQPVVPDTMAGYSGTPLPKKLGIKPGSSLMLLHAPEDFESLLGPIVNDITIRRGARGHADTVMLFATSKATFKRKLSTAIRAIKDEKGASLWICWPKKSSGVTTDLTQTVVRDTGLASGIVDYKFCAIDDTWSGLRFAKRK